MSDNNFPWNEWDYYLNHTDVTGAADDWEIELDSLDERKSLEEDYTLCYSTLLQMHCLPQGLKLLCPQSNTEIVQRTREEQDGKL